MSKHYLMPHDKLRLLELARVFEDAGGELTITIGDLSAKTGIPTQSITRHVQWMERYGLVAVTRTAKGFALGRSPNTYHLKMSVAQWRERGKAIVDEYRRLLYAGGKQTPRKSGGRPRVVEELEPDVAAQVERDVEDAVAAVAKLAPMSDAEAAAWG